MQKKRPLLLILDANALLHRAWHALPPLKAPDGRVVNAVYGVLSVVLKLLEQEKPDAFVACWDTAAPTFRHEAYEAYKANREEKEDELYEQIPITKSVLETAGITSVEKDGFEADDLIATFSERGVKDGYHVRIVTGDRDTLQLVAPEIDVLTFKKGVTETRIFDEDEVHKEYGVSPNRVIDWKAIKGDPSDNIPGIPGIGDKGATDLLQRFKSLQGVLKAAHDSKTDIKEGMRKKILDGEASALQAYDLVTLDRHVPMKQKTDEFTLALNREAFIEAAATYGFRSLIKRLPGKVDEERHMPSPTIKRKGVRTKESTQDAAAFLEACMHAKEIVMYVEAEAQGSLFGNAISAIAIGTEREVVVLGTSSLKDKKISAALTALLASDRIGKICHDAKAAMALLEGIDVSLEGIVHDTLIAAYLLAAGDRNFDLETLCLQYIGRELMTGEDRKRDAVKVIWAIAKKQSEEMKETGADRVMQRFELPLIPVLRSMERNGILVDVTYLGVVSKEMGKVKAKLEETMERVVGHPFNPASPSQLAVILFDELNLPTKGIKHGKTGYSTAASELAKLEGTHEIIDLIYEHRELAKLLSTYVDALPKLADKEGRIHTTFNQAIAATGRLSSSDPNLQNIPIRTELGRKIRQAFIASPGMELVACDYSQIELRVVAALAKDEKMLEAFRKGIDIHTATAANIWGIAPDKVTKEQRRSAKAINFGIIYGQGPMGLSRTAGISFAEAKEFIKKYFETYKGVKQYLDETKALAHKLGYVETLFGRRRYLPDINSGIHMLQAAAERMAINMPVQGTATGDLIKLALIEIAGGLSSVSSGSRLLLQVHDEILLEVPKKEVKIVASYVKDVMEHIENIGCPIQVDANHGENWNEMKRL